LIGVPLARPARWARAMELEARGRRPRLAELPRAAWPLLQATAAATLAWVVAADVLDHREPFFAPIAAVVALNAPLGRRGGNALRLLLGVIVGIVVGELTVGALGSDALALAIATFVAMAIATALDGARIVIAQAAAGAILTVAVARGDFGVQRVSDSVVGAGVALAFSQLLFSPDPFVLLRRAEGAALAEMADGLHLTARALARDDDELAELAMRRLRRVNYRMAEVDHTRAASDRVARLTPVWRSKMRPVERASENARRLDLLGASSLVLARSAIGTAGRERRALAPAVRDIADTLDGLARAPGDRAVRRRAADRARAGARRLPHGDAVPGPSVGAAVAAARLVAGDVVAFAGVDASRTDAVIADRGVPAPRGPTSRSRPSARGRRRADHRYRPPSRFTT
jgi:uncharacterized membrane protein YgaE (UPF0421/DUF939 family)